MNKKNDKIDKQIRSYLLFQMSECETNFKVSYNLWSKEYRFDNYISDTISINCKAILSDYKGIKPNDIIEFKFHIEPSMLDKKCNPEAFGGFHTFDKRLCCVIYVPPTFPERLISLINMG